MPQLVPSHAALALGVLVANAAHACPDPEACSSSHADEILPITLVQSTPLPESLAGLIDAQTYATLDPAYQMMTLRWSIEGVADAPLAMCFAPGTDPAIVSAIQTTLDRLTPRANPVDRWTSTVTNPTTVLGEPITLRYSFVPDGTQITNGGTSDLQARLNTIYGNNTAAWQSLFQQAFDRWSQLSGVNYVFEPNDDGAVFPTSNGSLNVRGDVRIGGHPIDGNFNVLAYNFFPNQGDMVLDTSDSYFTQTGNNSRALRNVVMHEHGHGLGFAHVCPINGTKLMEPTANNSYDGPRHDDLRAVQRNYGDPFEPNNAAVQATVLGSLPVGTTILGTPPAPGIPLGSILSIDANAEQDWFRFTATANTQVSVTVTPVGNSYDDSDQANTGACNSGNIIDSSRVANLEVQIFATNGVNILANANTLPLGAAETATTILPTAGDYYFRVAESDAPVEAQLYSVSIQIAAPNIAISQVGEAPRIVPPNSPVDIDFDIVGNLQSVQPGSPTLNFRLLDDPDFQTAPLDLITANQYRASLPLIACGQTIEYYISARGTAGAVATYPADAPATLLSTSAGVATVAFEDDFETDRSWTVTGAATTGQWVRADPVGTSAQPEDDHSTNGTLCFVTGNGTPGGPVGEADVDGGTTILTSPAFDLSDALDTTISYWRWYHNATTSTGVPNADTFPIEISGTNGITWNPVETVGPTTENVGGWIQHTFNTSEIPGFVPSRQVRIRFTAQDTGSASVVEAAIDDVLVTKISCPTTPACVADKDDGSGTGTPDGAVTIDDLLYFVSVFTQGAIDADVDDGSSTATPDGAVTIDDLLFFIVRFNAGC